MIVFEPDKEGFEKQPFLFCEAQAFNAIHKMATNKKKAASAERK